MATISTVKLCNMALSHIGKGTIESLEETSPAAKQCKLWFDIAKLETLEAFDWSFARKRVTLAPDSEDPPGTWAYRYQYPAQCAAFRRIVNPLGEDADPVPYVIELNDEGTRRTILTNEEDAVAVVTKDLTDPSLFSFHFNMCLSFKLASYLAYPLTANRQIGVDMINAWNFYLRQAPAQNANGERGNAERWGSLVEAR